MKLFPGIILAAGLSLGVSSAEAKTVDGPSARTVATNFLAGKGIDVSKGLTLTYTASGDINGAQVASYYVFNANSGHAFVMVSADDAIRPILAYSDEAAFDINKLSPAAKRWIGGYHHEAQAAIKNGVPAKPATQQSWAALTSGTHTTGAAARTTNAGPLLSLTWNQSPYYNQYCPGSGDYQSPTGCVATAMSQVMKFWNWPTTGTGNYQYLCYSYDGSPMLLNADFGNTSYDWSAMPDDISGSVPSVAQLMLHAGVSVDMYYDTTESGAYVLEQQSYRRTQCTEYALKTYFHYKRSLRGLIRNGTTYTGVLTGNIDSIAESDWTNILRTELSAGRPIIYCGYGGLGGHAWVCDGWESSDLFHFNWGWGGVGPNGYYTVDDLAPAVMGIGSGGASNFNTDQGIIIGIEPDSFANTPGSLQLSAHLNSVTSIPMPYASPFSITTTVNNTASTAFSGDICAEVFDTLNTGVGIIQTYPGVNIAAGASSDYTFATSGLLGMIPMDYYHIQIMYRPTGGTAWTPVANNGVYVNYTTADVMNDTDIALAADINITSSLPATTGGSVSLTAQLLNQGYSAFNGTIQAIMINIATGVQYPVQSLPSQTIDSNGTVSLSFSNAAITAPNGLYALVIQHQYGGTGSFYTTSSDYYENPVLMRVGSDVSVGVQQLQAALDVYPVPAKGIVYVQPNGEAVQQLTIYDILGRNVLSIAGNGKQLMAVNVATLASGTYFMSLQTTNGGIVEKKIVIE
jgi:Peptidase C10 family/Spi protease inhibitor/Secretion system C-terminal sorting domain